MFAEIERENNIYKHPGWSVKCPPEAQRVEGGSVWAEIFQDSFEEERDQIGTAWKNG